MAWWSSAMSLARLYTSNPRIFLTLAMVYAAICAAYFAVMMRSALLSAWLGARPRPGTHAQKFYYAKWLLAIKVYQARLFACVFLVLALVALLVYIFQQ